jgi:hypothetical protein
MERDDAVFITHTPNGYAVIPSTISAVEAAMFGDDPFEGLTIAGAFVELTDALSYAWELERKNQSAFGIRQLPSIVG